MISEKTIIILGGGIGGVVCANRLAKKVGNKAEIILVDKNATHIYQPSFLRVLFGERGPEQIQKPLSLLKRKDIEVVQDEILKIIPENKAVKTKNRDFKYDYLIISLGAELAPEKIPGLNQAGFNLYELRGIEKLRDELQIFSEGKIAVVISSLPFKCPAAPYEAAFLLDEYFRKRNIRDKVEIGVFTPESLPLPAVGPENGKIIKSMIESRNIKFNPELNLVSVAPDKKEIIFKENKIAKFDILIFVPPHQGEKAIRESGIGNEAGWIPVDKKTLQAKYENVFAIGDAAFIALASGKPLPKAGVFAHLEAEVAADNIANDIKGINLKKEYDGQGSCFLETGFGKAGFASGKFYAEPDPQIKIRRPARIWHLGKVLFEKYWFWKWF